MGQSESLNHFAPIDPNKIYCEFLYTIQFFLDLTFLQQPWLGLMTFGTTHGTT